jgi:hypothetical protein
MEHRSNQWQRAGVLLAALCVAACAAYGGRGLQPGVAALPDVLAVMGEPALRWPAADGSLQLAYPRGPAGYHTFMVFLGADGRLQRIENVLDMPHFARLEPGKSDQAAVLRLLGPSDPAGMAYFKARDELVWEYRFCDDWGEAARFDVLFDATSGVVRTAYQRRENTRRRTVCSR